MLQCYVCVVRSQVEWLTLLIGSVFKALYCSLCILSKLWPLQGRKKYQILVLTSRNFHCLCSFGDKFSLVRNNACVWLFRAVFGITDCCYNAAWCNILCTPNKLLLWQASGGEIMWYSDFGRFCGIKTYNQRGQILYYAASHRYIQYCSKVWGQ